MQVILIIQVISINNTEAVTITAVAVICLGVQIKLI